MLVTAITTPAVTPAHQAQSGARASGGAKNDRGDVFAAMLGDDAKDASTATSNKSGDPASAAMTLASMQALTRIQNTAKPAASGDGTALSGDADATREDISKGVTPATDAKMPAKSRTDTKARPGDTTSDPAQAPAQNCSAVTPQTSADPATMAAAPATDPTTPATQPASATTAAAVQTIAAAAADADDDTAATTDLAAAPMRATGSTAKPGRPGDAKSVATDSAKSQKQSSAASALADAGKAIGHKFDPKAADAQTLHVAADATKQANGGPATTTPDAKAAPAVSDASQAPARTDTPAIATPHAQQPAAQPATSNAQAVAATAAAAPTATTGAATHVGAQLQIARAPAEAAPDTNALAFSIASRAQGGEKHFDIRLDPVELGRIDVHLTVDDAGKAQAMLSVEKPETMQLLQKDSSHLERALKDAGLDLTQNGLNFSLKGQQQQAGQQGGNASSSARGRFAARAIAAVNEAASTASLGQVSSSDTRLDIRV